MPNNLYCSFCNESEDQTGPLLAKMGAGPKRHPVRICKDCAEMAIDTIDREVLRRASEQPRRRVIWRRTLSEAVMAARQREPPSTYRTAFRNLKSKKEN